MCPQGEKEELKGNHKQKNVQFKIVYRVLDSRKLRGMKGSQDNLKNWEKKLRTTRGRGNEAVKEGCAGEETDTMLLGI